jgi:hypothetical protein
MTVVVGPVAGVVVEVVLVEVLQLISVILASMRIARVKNISLFIFSFTPIIFRAKYSQNFRISITSLI